MPKACIPSMCLHLDQPQSLFLMKLKRKRNNHSFIQSFEKTKQQQVQKEVKRLLLSRKRMHDEHHWWSWCDGDDGPWYNSPTSFIIGYVSLEQFHWCLVCDLIKIFLTSKICLPLFFSTPTHKTKIWTTNKWETTNSNPPRPIKLSSQ